jgi:rhodanese-related sulfurtransferase
MSATVKDLLSAARAAVSAITPAEAADLVAKADALVVDVRDGTEVAASGKVKGALAVSRGLLEFKADPDVPTHDPALRKDRPVILYCGSGGRAALAGKTLLDMGFKDVRNVGGFKGLVDANWEVRVLTKDR